MEQLRLLELVFTSLILSRAKEIAHARNCKAADGAEPILPEDMIEVAIKEAKDFHPLVMTAHRRLQTT